MSGDIKTLTAEGFKEELCTGEDEIPPYYSKEELNKRCLNCDPLKCQTCHGNKVDPIEFYDHLRQNCQENNTMQSIRDDLKECAWKRTNYQTLAKMDQMLVQSGKVNERVRKLISSKIGQAPVEQTISNKAIQNRIQDLAPMTFALKEEWEGILEEIGMLMTTKRMLEKAFLANETPLLISTECLQTRERRLPSERTQDNLQDILEQNILHAQFVKESLELAIRVTEKHLQYLRDIKLQLEKDRSFQVELGILIENMCSKSSENSGIIGTSIVEGLRDLTLKNIDNSRRTRMASEAFRTIAENLTAKITKDVIRLNDDITRALKTRVHDVDIARADYIGKLKEVTLEVEKTETKINDLSRAMNFLEVPYSITKSRLERSKDTPGMEMTLEPAKKVVNSELARIKSAIDALKAQMEESEQELSELNKSRLDLEMKIAAKYQALDVDYGKCTPIRDSFPEKCKLLGH